MTIERAFGAVMRRMRKERALSQGQLAALCNLDRAYISLVETGKKNPTLVSIYSFAAGLNVSPQQIFCELEAILRINGIRTSRRPRFPQSPQNAYF